LVDWLVLESAITVFFGRGSALKGYFTNALELAIATGATDFLGHKIRRAPPLLIVDYEDPEAFWLRLRRIAEGVGMDPSIIDDLPIEVVDQPEGPLVNFGDRIVNQVRLMEDRYGQRPVFVVDSATYACPEPSKEWAVNPFFTFLRKLALPTIVIAHVGWAQLENEHNGNYLRRAYGHIMWDTGPRRTFSFDRSGDEDTDTIITQIVNQKSNGKKSAPFGVQFDFEGTNGPVRLARVGAPPPVVATGIERVEAFMKRRIGNYFTAAEVASQNDIKQSTASTYLGELKDQRKVFMEGGKGKTTRYSWNANYDGQGSF
jgi:hypothetical protein